MNNTNKKRTIKRTSPEAYDKEYFLSDLTEGYDEFKKGSLSLVKEKILNMLEIKRGLAHLEVGIGRGELLYHCAKRGAKVTGIDYSKDAIEIAKKTLKDFPGADISVNDATDLPFESNSFDRTFAGDILEHMDYEDGIKMLKEMYRVLKPGGFMLIHTSPNTVFEKFSYPLARPLLGLIDKNSVKTLDNTLNLSATNIWDIHKYNLFSLKKAGKDAGLKNAKVWIDEDILRSNKSRFTQGLSKSKLIKFIGFCGKYRIISFLLGNDLYLKCYKEKIQLETPMINPIKLSIITLVYQNEKIEDYIREIHEKIIKKFKALQAGDVEFIVAEDGSNDNTRNILRNIKDKYGLILNLGIKRRGYIGAAKEVYMQAKGEYIFFADSDRENNPGDFWKLWDKFQKENLDIVVGYRKNRRPYYRYLITKIHSLLTGLLFNVWLGDANCGFRIIKRNAVQKIIPLTGNLMAIFNAEFFIIAKQLRYSYKEVPIEHFPQASVVFPIKKIPVTLMIAFFEVLKFKFKALKGGIK